MGLLRLSIESPVHLDGAADAFHGQGTGSVGSSAGNSVKRHRGKAAMFPDCDRPGASGPTRTRVCQVLCLNVRVNFVPLALVVKALLVTSGWVETDLNWTGLWKPRN